MAARIADRLSQVRRRAIFGRDTEIALLRDTLSAPELPFCVLNIFGPGGIGKSTILHAYADLCASMEVACFSLNARDIEPSPQFFLRSLSQAMGLDPAANVIEALAESPRRQVLLVDTFEAIQALETWLREEFLPELSSETLVVLAGRSPVSAAWRSDASWQSLLHILSLRNLNPEDSRRFLAENGIPAEQQESVLEFTYGYPLALSLISDVFRQRGLVEIASGPNPGVVQSLVEAFIDRTPSPLHRTALEASALVRVTTEPLLARLLGIDDGRELFEWLRSLSFMEASRPGICPHNVARECLTADLRWRNPDRYADLHRNARSYYGDRLGEAPESEQQRLLWDYIFLHRENPMIRASFTWNDALSAFAGPAQETDFPLLHRWVETWEGPEAAAHLAAWWNHPAATTLVVRPSVGATSADPLGFLLRIALEQVDAAAPRDDAIESALRFLRRQAPLRTGEVATHFRFWMAGDTYHEVSPVQSLLMVNAVRHYLTTPGLAYSFFPVTNPERWEAAYRYAEFDRIAEGQYQQGNRTFTVFAHDWRSQPPLAWLGMLAEKELSGHATEPPANRTEDIVVLSQEEFAAAIRDGLRQLDRVESLSNNPLLRSRIVLERTRLTDAATADRAATLQNLLRETIKKLKGSVRQERAHRALHHTYLQPAPSQERAAEILDLPFSTYRRHLAEGIAMLVETLWQQEIGILNK